MENNVHWFTDEALSVMKEVGVSDILIQFAGANIKRNDAAHYFDHVSDVIVLSYKYATEATKETEMHREEIIFCSVVAALLHDVACHVDRDSHHSIACVWIQSRSNDQLISEGINPKYKTAIANAIFEHRASFTGVRKSIISEIVAAADRGRIDSTEFLRRSYLYARSHGKNVNSATKHAAEHIKTKFGTGGYGYTKFPEICHLNFPGAVERVSTELDDIDRSIKTIKVNRDQWESDFKEITNGSSIQSGSK